MVPLFYADHIGRRVEYLSLGRLAFSRPQERVIIWENIPLSFKDDHDSEWFRKRIRQHHRRFTGWGDALRSADSPHHVLGRCLKHSQAGYTLKHLLLFSKIPLLMIRAERISLCYRVLPQLRAICHNGTDLRAVSVVARASPRSQADLLVKLLAAFLYTSEEERHHHRMMENVKDYFQS